MGVLGAVIVVLLALLLAMGIWHCKNRRLLRDVRALSVTKDGKVGRGLGSKGARDSIEDGIVEGKNARFEYWK